MFVVCVILTYKIDPVNPNWKGRRRIFWSEKPSHDRFGYDIDRIVGNVSDNASVRGEMLSRKYSGAFRKILIHI